AAAADGATAVVQHAGAGDGERGARLVRGAGQYPAAGVVDPRRAQAGASGRVDIAVAVVQHALRLEVHGAAGLKQASGVVEHVPGTGDGQRPVGEQRAGAVVERPRRDVGGTFGADQAVGGVGEQVGNPQCQGAILAALDQAAAGVVQA